MRVISAIVLCGGMVACVQSTPYRTGFDFLEGKGFRAPLFAQVSLGDVMKNINQEVPALLDVMKEAVVCDHASVSAEYSVGLQKGSSMAADGVAIAVDKSGDGFIEYLGTRVYFTCPALREFCAAAFERSSIIIK